MGGQIRESAEVREESVSGALERLQQRRIGGHRRQVGKISHCGSDPHAWIFAVSLQINYQLDHWT